MLLSIATFLTPNTSAWAQFKSAKHFSKASITLQGQETTFYSNSISKININLFSENPPPPQEGDPFFTVYAVVFAGGGAIAGWMVGENVNKKYGGVIGGLLGLYLGAYIGAAISN
jgi:uncharacterized membrane protein